jgi:hypothetical protein
MPEDSQINYISNSRVSIKGWEVPSLGKPTKYSFVNLLKDVSVDPEKWSRIPSEQDIAATVAALEKGNIKVIRVKDGAGALEKISDLIHPGSEVMNGSSTTLIEIGYEDLINSQRNWKDLRKAILSENDDRLRNDLRRRSVTAEYFLSGVNAIAKTGQILACDASGSRVGAWPFAAENLILVSGVNKIVPTIQDALQRIWDYAYPLEDARARKVYGMPSQIGKCVILAKEGKRGRVTLILIDEVLGY